MNALSARTIIATVTLCLAACPAFAQEKSAAGSPSCVIFPIQDLSPGSKTGEYQQTITDSLTVWFQVAGFDIVAPEAQSETQGSDTSQGVALSESQALSAAAAVNAGLALTGYYVVQQDQIAVAIQVWDVPDHRLLTGIQERAPLNLAFFSALHDWVQDMLTRVNSAETPPASGEEQPQTPGQAPEKQSQAPQTAQTIGPATLPTVTFVSRDEGMEVSLPGGVKVGPITNGRLSWENSRLEQGAVFQVLKQKQGYHDEWQTVRAAEEIHLSSLAKSHSQAVEADWTFGQLAGLGTTFRAYVVPDNSFLFLSGYFYVQPPLSSAGRFVYHYDGSLGAGGYILFPPQAFFRLGVSTGLGGIMSVAPGGTYTDLYLNLLNWWLEMRPIGSVVVFLRQEFKLTTGIGNNLLGVGLMSVQNLPPFTLGVGFEW